MSKLKYQLINILLRDSEKDSFARTQHYPMHDQYSITDGIAAHVCTPSASTYALAAALVATHLLRITAIHHLFQPPSSDYHLRSIDALTCTPAPNNGTDRHRQSHSLAHHRRTNATTRYCLKKQSCRLNQMTR